MHTDFIVVSGPFAAPHYPSIQLGLLQALAAERGIVNEGVYANLDFYSRINQRLYDMISDHRGIQVGDWIFSNAAFPESQKSNLFQETFQNEIRSLCEDAQIDQEYLEQVQDIIVPQFVQDTALNICAKRPKAVGFSSTFEQNLASFAIARAIKKIDPNIMILFGGANFDGEMGAELFRKLTWIDVVVIGEVEPCFDGLMTLLKLNDIGGHYPLDGILSRIPGSEKMTASRATYTNSMDLLPTPDYKDYFAALSIFSLNQESMSKKATLPFEGARGCWWGQKHHCTFCGLNGAGMEFRKKSADKILKEIASLSTMYKVQRLAAVDNIISPSILRDISVALESSESDYEIFYELKANLKKDEIRDLSNAGIKYIQPGIESLSTNVLKLMKKGIRAIQNVNTLKWALHYNISISWNLLYGFPGETTDDYENQLNLLKKVTHLPPPVGGGRIWLERFSPYFTGKESGFYDIRPESSLYYIYPENIDIDKIAYFFTGRSLNTITDYQYNSTNKFVLDWRNKWLNSATRPYLFYRGGLDQIKIFDGRSNPDKPKVYTYLEPIGTLLKFCGEKPRSFSQIYETLSSKFSDISIDESNLTAALNRLIERSLLLHDDDLYLFLGLPMTHPRK